jgi:hypothetical protein
MLNWLLGATHHRAEITVTRGLHMDDGLALWATVITLLISALLYPVIVKICRRGRTNRPDGLYIISEPDNKDVTFEIVAVHGLGAHPEYTWTSQAPSRLSDSEDVTRVHLLKDLLKDDFPDARILAFAHNSDWLINAPVNTAQQIGDRLLDELVEHRKKHLVRTTKAEDDTANRHASAFRSSSSAIALGA